jgi:flagellar basal-body rod protein FlgG
MSTKGIYTALSGAMAQNSRLDTIANNIANSNTPAFKRDQQVFKEYLTANEKMPEVIQAPRIVASVESFYDMQGGDKSYVDQAGTYTDHSQGALKLTGNSFDTAIDGKGFFEVATTQGPRLTRNGSFKIDGMGQLVSKEGYPILMSASPGTDPAQRVLHLDPKGGAITITEDGTLYQNNQALGKLSVVDVTNPDVLHKQGDSLYTFKPNMTPEVVNVDRPVVKQGYLEGSNVNIVREMTDMITASRSFESAQKAIHAYDQMDDKLVNSVPKLG